MRVSMILCAALLAACERTSPQGPHTLPTPAGSSALMDVDAEADPFGAAPEDTPADAPVILTL